MIKLSKQADYALQLLFALATATDGACVSLKKIGRSWRYSLPEYSPEEKSFIRCAILDALSEAGIIARGTYKDKECLMVTPFGCSLFAR